MCFNWFLLGRYHKITQEGLTYFKKLSFHGFHQQREQPAQTDIFYFSTAMRKLVAKDPKSTKKEAVETVSPS